uniref:EGF-like domain-containing protein n=1 Tax=Panagrolaimus sp. PS1159 TaxID=55785 RepID=A0AC35FA19_9BILA
TTQKATTRRIRPTFAFDETELLTTSTPTTTSPVTTTIRTSVTTRTRPLTFEITPLSPKQKLFNECSNCAVQSTCINGRCQCNIGWKGNGKICEDVDECSNPLTCGEHAVCQNTLGSYSCICNVGFIATSTGCKDVDECDEEIVTCKGGNTTQCINTIGGYE